MAQQNGSSLWFYLGLVWTPLAVETAAASMAGSPLPVSVVWFGAAALVLGGLAALVARLETRNWLPREGMDRFWYGLAAGVLLLKFRQAGVLGETWPWVLLAGLIATPWVLSRWDPAGRGRMAGGGLFLLAAAVSPDLAGIPGPFGSVLSVPWFLLPVVLAAPILAGLVLRSGRTYGLFGLRSRPARAGLLLVGLLFAAGSVWMLESRPKSPLTPFTGRLPAVERTAASSETSLPNIILISIDTLRWDYVPPRAPHELELPHLRKLRRDSVVFPRHSVTSSLTYPSHASLFSGLLPVRNGAVGYSPIDPEVPHYPQLLRRLGYRTLAFTGGVGVSRELGFGRGFERYWEYPGRYDELVPGGLQLVEMVLYASGRPLLLRWRPRGLTGQGLRFFRETVARGLRGIDDVEAREDPFLLFLHTYEVHDFFKVYPRAFRRARREHPDLFDVPRIERLLTMEFEDALADFQDHLPGIYDRLRRSGDGRFAEEYRGLSPRQKHVFDRLLKQGGALDGLAEMDLDADEERRMRLELKGYLLQVFRIYEKLYGHGVESMDRALGRLLSELRRRELYRDSLIIFTSDHGEGFLVDSPSVFHGPGDLSEVLLRTPLWIKLPGNRHAGESVEELVQITDVFPSILRYLGVKPSLPAVEARVRPVDTLLPGSRAPRRNFVHGSVMAEDLRTSVPNLFVGDGHHKFVRSKNSFRHGWYRVMRRGLREEAVDTDAVPEAGRERLLGELERLEKTLRETRRRQEGLRRDISTTLWKDLEGMGYL